MEERMNLYQKIQAVANKVMSIEKDMTVGVGNYQYKAVSDLSVTKSVKEAEKDYKIVSIPIRQEVIHQEVIRIQEKDKERINYSFLVKMTTRIIDLEKPDDFIEVETFGHGLDSGDKGFGKASTYARKYALLNVYKIATGEDPDSHASSQERTLRNDEIKNKIFHYLSSDNRYLQNILNHFNVSGMEDLTKSQIETIYMNLKKKKAL
jgi:hypothetical protein